MSTQQSEWVWDYAAGKYVYWIAASQGRRGYWIDENHQQTAEPQFTPTVTVAPEPSSSRSARSSKNAPGGVRTSETSLSDVAAGIEGLHIRKTSPSSTILTDRKTGDRIQWDVTNTISYHDPGIRDSQRQLSAKRIREYPAKKDRKSSETTVDYYKNRYAPGRVIEVELGASDQTSLVTISTRGSGIRLRRFVITRSFPTRHCFEAIAIKTNQLLGVAAPGTIKAHYTVIYTQNKTGYPPPPQKDEEPKRTPAGDIEDGMQADAILVVPYDLAQALDPMARLDYADRWEFDWYAPNIEVFGKVHDNFLASLFAQYNTISVKINPAISNLSFATSASVKGTTAGPSKKSGESDTRGILGSTAGATRASSTKETDWSSTRATGGSSSKKTGGSGSKATAGPSTGPAAALSEQEEKARRIYEKFRSAKSGPCTVDEMRVIVAYLQNEARKIGVSPSPDLTPKQLQELAQHAEKRQKWINAIIETAEWEARQ